MYRVFLLLLLLNGSALASEAASGQDLKMASVTVRASEQASETVSEQAGAQPDDRAGDRAAWLAIAWTDDEQEALARAAASGRPVLVYFQAHWCSWCHLYERDTLGDAVIIRAIGDNFVALRINVDERPDLLAKYRGFGLPHTVILSASGHLLARLPGILSPADLFDSLNGARQPVRSPSPRYDTPADIQPDRQYKVELTGRAGKLDQQAYQRFVRQWLDHLAWLYDPATASFSGVLESGSGLKRPAVQTWIWLLESGHWRQRTHRAALASLQNLYDAENGGFFFFRDPHRDDAHLETAKLVDANAWLIYWFSLAAQRYGDAALRQAARNSRDYLLRTLWDPVQGGFFQAQVADAGYYRAGGKAGRAPAVDRIKRTDSNARAAIALMQTAKLTKDRALQQKALATIDYLLDRHLRHDRLYHSRSDRGFGSASNLPEDIFWLLTAIQVAKQAAKEAGLHWQVPSASQAVYRLAGLWLASAMQGKAAHELPAQLLGLVAYVAVNSGQPHIPPRTTRWALSQIHLRADTRPDELVYAFRAWRQYLGREYSGVSG